ncbi:E3 ubiquitin-protein ligase PUB24 [Ricinus communis]|uniref:E3 ubiquitin-protein ligase PUB24 n=1 Tax=Ricinus communis TaxID=3988 RepID=UPI00201A4609|nr:E3 ubiquitin-protein ligase PUB24 [Ricinus communis]
MDEVQIPEYYLCPISLQIMKDPVTTITGITYDRESIEQWLRTTAKDTPTCPFTKQPLPRDADLTPNHMLLRLIQAWCTANAKNGIDPIPTPKPSLSKTYVLKLVKDLQVPYLCVQALKKMEALATENERNRACMMEAGVAKGLVPFVIRCFKERMIKGIEEALKILDLTWNSSEEIKLLIKDNYDFIDSLIWVSGCNMDNHVVVKIQSMLVLKKTIELATTSLLERLKPDFFRGIVRVLKENISQQALKSALLILIEVCPWGRNRIKIVEAKAVFVLIELELEKPEKNITELIFNLLAQLCSCADGREQLLKHAGSIAMISKRILRVSPATDDRAVHVLGLVSKFYATNEVLVEMLSVGAVSKLCMVIQADCASYLKQKAREILRLRSNVWNNSPCIAVYLLTRYPR